MEELGRMLLEGYPGVLKIGVPVPDHLPTHLGIHYVPEPIHSRHARKGAPKTRARSSAPHPSQRAERRGPEHGHREHEKVERKHTVSRAIGTSRESDYDSYSTHSGSRYREEPSMSSKNPHNSNHNFTTQKTSEKYVGRNRSIQKDDNDKDRGKRRIEKEEVVDEDQSSYRRIDSVSQETPDVNTPQPYSTDSRSRRSSLLVPTFSSLEDEEERQNRGMQTSLENNKNMSSENRMDIDDIAADVPIYSASKLIPPSSSVIRSAYKSLNRSTNENSSSRSYNSYKPSEDKNDDYYYYPAKYNKINDQQLFNGNIQDKYKNSGEEEREEEEQNQEEHILTNNNKNNESKEKTYTEIGPSQFTHVPAIKTESSQSESVQVSSQHLSRQSSHSSVNDKVNDIPAGTLKRMDKEESEDEGDIGMPVLECRKESVPNLSVKQLFEESDMESKLNSSNIVSKSASAHESDLFHEQVVILNNSPNASIVDKILSGATVSGVKTITPPDNINDFIITTDFTKEIERMSQKPEIIESTHDSEKEPSQEPKKRDYFELTSSKKLDKYSLALTLGNKSEEIPEHNVRLPRSISSPVLQPEISYEESHTEFLTSKTSGRLCFSPFDVPTEQENNDNVLNLSSKNVKHLAPDKDNIKVLRRLNEVHQESSLRYSSMKDSTSDINANIITAKPTNKMSWSSISGSNSNSSSSSSNNNHNIINKNNNNNNNNNLKPLMNNDDVIDIKSMSDDEPLKESRSKSSERAHTIRYSPVIKNIREIPHENDEPLKRDSLKNIQSTVSTQSVTQTPPMVRAELVSAILSNKPSQEKTKESIPYTVFDISLNKNVQRINQPAIQISPSPILVKTSATIARPVSVPPASPMRSSTPESNLSASTQYLRKSESVECNRDSSKLNALKEIEKRLGEMNFEALEGNVDELGIEKEKEDEKDDDEKEEYQEQSPAEESSALISTQLNRYEPNKENDREQAKIGYTCYGDDNDDSSINEPIKQRRQQTKSIPLGPAKPVIPKLIEKKRPREKLDDIMRNREEHVGFWAPTSWDILSTYRSVRAIYVEQAARELLHLGELSRIQKEAQNEGALGYQVIHGLDLFTNDVSRDLMKHTDVFNNDKQ